MRVKITWLQIFLTKSDYKKKVHSSFSTTRDAYKYGDNEDALYLKKDNITHLDVDSDDEHAKVGDSSVDYEPLISLRLLEMMN